MSKIRLDVDHTLVDGERLTFKAPCDCSSVDGIIVYCPNAEGVEYTVCDAMGECVTGVGGTWCSGALVSVVLDCENKKAYIQNSATAIKARTGTDYGTYRIRNVAILSATPESMSNGDIALVYS